MALTFLTPAERAAAEQRATTLLAASLRAIEILNDYNSRHPDRALRIEPLEQRAAVARGVLADLAASDPEIDLEPLRVAELCWPACEDGLPQPAGWAQRRLRAEG